jgi:serine/threonine protein kinase
MTTGKRPFDGRTHAVIFNSILTGIPTPPSQLRENVPQELARILEKALAKNRDERCQSAAEVKADLVRLQRDIGSGMAKAATGDSVRRRGNRLSIAIASSVVLIAAAVVFGFSLSKRKGPSPPGLSRQATVAVLPFQNAAQPRRLEFRRRAIRFLGQKGCRDSPSGRRLEAQFLCLSGRGSRPNVRQNPTVPGIQSGPPSRYRLPATLRALPNPNSINP